MPAPKKYLKYQNSGLYLILTDMIRQFEVLAPKYKDFPLLNLEHDYLLNLCKFINSTVLPFFSEGKSPGLWDLKNVIVFFANLNKDFNTSYQGLVEENFEYLESHEYRGRWYEIFAVMFNALHRLSLDTEGAMSFLSPKALNLDLHNGYVVAPILRKFTDGISGLIKSKDDSGLAFHFDIDVYKNEKKFLNLSFDFQTIFSVLKAWLAYYFYQCQNGEDELGLALKARSKAYFQAFEVQKKYIYFEYSTFILQMNELPPQDALLSIEDHEQVLQKLRGLKLASDEFMARLDNLKQEPLRAFLTPELVEKLGEYPSVSKILDNPLPNQVPGDEICDEDNLAEYNEIYAIVDSIWQLFDSVAPERTNKSEVPKIFKQHEGFLKSFLGEQNSKSLTETQEIGYDALTSLNFIASDEIEGLKKFPKNFTSSHAFANQVEEEILKHKKLLDNEKKKIQEQITYHTRKIRTLKLEQQAAEFITLENQGRNLGDIFRSIFVAYEALEGLPNYIEELETKKKDLYQYLSTTREKLTLEQQKLQHRFVELDQVKTRLENEFKEVTSLISSKMKELESLVPSFSDFEKPYDLSLLISHQQGLNHELETSIQVKDFLTEVRALFPVKCEKVPYKNIEKLIQESPQKFSILKAKHSTTGFQLLVEILNWYKAEWKEYKKQQDGIFRFRFPPEKDKERAQDLKIRIESKILEINTKQHFREILDEVIAAVRARDSIQCFIEENQRQLSLHELEVGETSEEQTKLQSLEQKLEKIDSHIQWCQGAQTCYQKIESGDIDIPEHYANQPLFWKKLQELSENSLPVLPDIVVESVVSKKWDRVKNRLQSQLGVWKTNLGDKTLFNEFDSSVKNFRAEGDENKVSQELSALRDSLQGFFNEYLLKVDENYDLYLVYNILLFIFTIGLSALLALCVTGGQHFTWFNELNLKDGQSNPKEILSILESELSPVPS